MLNRDIKVLCIGYKIKDSILKYVKEYLLFVEFIKLFEEVGELG